MLLPVSRQAFNGFTADTLRLAGYITIVERTILHPNLHQELEDIPRACLIVFGRDCQPDILADVATPCPTVRSDFVLIREAHSYDAAGQRYTSFDKTSVSW